MDVLAGAGAVAGMVAVAVAIWQLRVAVLDRRERSGSQRLRGRTGRIVTGARPVVAPLGRLPSEVVGREKLLAELRAALRRRRSAGVWVLGGLGGMGKSTVALTVAAEAQRSGRAVWWINAGDSVSMYGGLLEVLRQTDAPDDVVREVRDGRLTAPSRFWQFLADAGPDALMVFDNADNPSVLSVDGHGRPGDGDGWIRPDVSVFTLVTTRAGDARTWGDWVRLRRLGALSDDQAALLLRGIAPGVQDPDGTGVRALARRLGGLPLALHLAGAYLGSPFSQWRTFDAYRVALDTTGAAIAELDLESSGRITRTWEVSLDALATQGLEQARPFLYLVACFDPLTPTFASVLEREDAGRIVRGLAEVALVDVAAGPDFPAVTLHPVVADMCRARLRAGEHDDVFRAALAHLLGAGAGLDPERVEDWPGWERLVPHLAALVGWGASQADEQSLVSVLALGRRAVAALNLTASTAQGSRMANRSAGEDLAGLLETAATRLGEDHAAAIMARYDSAMVFLRSGDHSQTEVLLEAVLGSARRALGPRHRDTLLIRDGLAGLYLEQQRFAEAEQAYRALIADQETLLGEEDPDTLATRVDLAWAIGMQGRPSEAAAICETVAQTEERLLGAHHVRTLDARSDHARWLLEAGQIDEARRQAEDLLAVTVRVLGSDHPLSLLTRATVAKALAAAGHDTDALFVEILTTMEDLLGPLDYRTAIVRRDRSEAAGTRRDRNEP